ncbi:MAG: FtsX-like permease family protein, partial [Coriobacteriia bacterium]|nr:FtsX-like permease family protein [Coriobacteriia bacterium]
LESLSYVAVVSDEFLKANNLDLGGFVSFDQKEFIDDFRELIYSQPIQLEIVGVFNREFIPEDHPEQEDVQQYFNQINQVYVPAIVVESLTETFWEVLLEHDPEVYLEASAHREAEAPYHHGPVLFSLHDPVHLAPFREAAEEILPDFWLVDDFTNTYLLISASMEMVDEMALWIVIGVSIATAVIVALVILLFLHDRRFEVGVYLALGERKFRAIGQLVVEIMIATILGMTLGLLVGNMLSAEVSTMMIEQDMVRQLEDSERGIAGVAPALHWAGYRAHMTPEEMMEIYEIGLEVRTVIQFYALFLTAATFASVVSLWSITKMKPRELLSTLS